MSTTVGNVMTTALHTVSPEARLDAASLVMEERSVRQLLVVDETDRLLGLLSYRALLQIVAAQRADEMDQGVLVSEFMDPDPLTVRPDTNLRTAVRLMIQHQVSAVPVLDGDTVIGILSEHDVVRMTAGLLDTDEGDGP